MLGFKLKSNVVLKVLDRKSCV